MHYMIAVDGGGTKTRTVLFGEDGKVIFELMAPGSNPLDVGVEEARRRLVTAMREAAEKSPGPISGIYAGVAGLYYFNDFFGQDMRGKFNCEHFRIETDGRNLISCELTKEENGCCLIVGTGCGTWIRRKEKNIFTHTGGWGYMVDTAGSGYWLGREAVKAVCMAFDGRGKKTVLSELLAEKTGLPMPDCIPYLYDGGRARFASLAHIVFDGSREGDEVCNGIIEEGAERLAELIWTADRFFNEPYSVVMGGGIAENFPEYGELIRSKCPPRANVILAKRPPVFGAAVEAMHLCGLELPEDFSENFLSSLNH